MTTLSLKNISKSFGTGTAKVNALTNINFTANKGQLVLVIGPSGSGKSTFLTIAGGLQTPTYGEVTINNKKIQNLTSKEREKLRLYNIGFILQSYNLVPYLNVKDQFKLVTKFKKNGNFSNKELNNLLELLEIKQLENKFPNQLSGGQTQRVAIARAIYPNPEIILADEPTAALDSKRVAEVGKLLSHLAKTKAVIVVTHDLRLKKYANIVYEIMDGKIRQKS